MSHEAVILAYHLHNLDPVIVQFSESFAIRWYGLAYVLGFVAAYLLMTWLAKRGYGQIKPDETSDFITLAALLGVMLGGRLGYILLYAIPEGQLQEDPLMFIKIWKGGMASHGGILGLVLFTFFYARQKKYNWAGVGDNLVSVAPLGIFFGRMANFINGELYGKPAPQHGWAWQFPNEMRDFPYSTGQAVLDQLPDYKTFFSNGQLDIYSSIGAVQAAIDSDPAVQHVLRETLNPRYPSQIYQGLMEGLLLFVILFLVRIRFKKLPYGILTGLFFINYAVFRIVGEVFRHADSGHIAGLSKGQFYSVFFIAIGIAFLYYGMTRGKRAVEMKNPGLF
ncbi:MAG: prolipoprotein diacylglyceryl transferase [Verrucomicrobiota bacterium]